MNPVLVLFETLTLVLLVAFLWPVAKVLIAYSTERSVARVRPGREVLNRCEGRPDRYPDSRQAGVPYGRRLE